MGIRIEGAEEHNLKGFDVVFPEGLSVVTGVSGSGKSSLVFDTIYHEARRKYLDALGTAGLRLSPANVRSIEGLGPVVAVGQDLLNRNPNSTLATASGLHPFLRLLYARFGERRCRECGGILSMMSEDQLVDKLKGIVQAGEVEVYAPVMRGVAGSHRTLLALLCAEFGEGNLVVDGRPFGKRCLNAPEKHDIDVRLGRLGKGVGDSEVEKKLQVARSLGAHSIRFSRRGEERELGFHRVCPRCGMWYGELHPIHFKTRCPYCKGEGCGECADTGLHPEAAAVLWRGMIFPRLLARSVHQLRQMFLRTEMSGPGQRLLEEIESRLEVLARVGLGYVCLDRPSPTLSRGEAQRVRLAMCLAGRLEDMLHLLDEPTIGQHPADVKKLLPAFRDLAGPVIYVEHDRVAAAFSDHAVDLGPGAGGEGGYLLFEGPPSELWKTDAPSGLYFSGRSTVRIPDRRPEPTEFVTVRQASMRNLKQIDVTIPTQRLTVITGVSGSGKSTFVEDVLVRSLRAKTPSGCAGIEGPALRTVFVDQSPIGKNPRSNPATYTKLSDSIRDIYAAKTGLSASHFSFNRPEGACPECKGMGALEVRLRYLPSTWITCPSCAGRRFSEEVLTSQAMLGNHELSIAEFYDLTVSEVVRVLSAEVAVPKMTKQSALRVLRSMEEIGLGYIRLGQPSPTLSGGEAQRIKLVKHMGRRSLSGQLMILDEPSTGLHPWDIDGLLSILDRLVRSGATIVVVEHNTDIIRAADWAIDLGPGAGPEGGQIIYSGPVAGLTNVPASSTGRALSEEVALLPRKGEKQGTGPRAQSITVRRARVHNLKSIDVTIPKGALTVVTGVSGSGKSSLVGDVIEAEARRRYLESLSMYERQTTKEGPEPEVAAVTGLGVSLSLDPETRMLGRRSTVGSLTEIANHLSVLLTWLGERRCSECGLLMERETEKNWMCPECGSRLRVPSPSRFLSTTYAGACIRCHGVGTITVPEPKKLIVDPDRPICAGAMYSPGFFPKGYICKPYNGGYYHLQALGRRFGFDPHQTPWNDMSEEARKAFLFGTSEELRIHYESKSGRRSTRTARFPGFFGWIGDWDFGGTYTRQAECPDCGGGRLRPEYLAVRVAGKNMAEFTEMPLSSLLETLDGVDMPSTVPRLVDSSLNTILKRLRFLVRVGLGYLNLNRLTLTLSAGEAQRIRLAGLLGSSLSSLTIIVDEPSRGLHPCEVGTLASALKELVQTGNTAIVVEHDLDLIRAADHVIDLGPGPGMHGGEVIAQGLPERIGAAKTPTGRWLRGEGKFLAPKTRSSPKGWLVVRGARANNLKGSDIGFPLGMVVGVCGVSGSGKSTLIVDTIARVLAPKRQTTSVAYEPIRPGEHDSIEGVPERAVVVDQTKQGVTSPSDLLGLEARLRSMFSQSEDAMALGVDEAALGRDCSACGGRGYLSVDMGFLPDVRSECETCDGTGYGKGARYVQVRGHTLPDLCSKTIDEVYEIFSDDPSLSVRLQAARDVGLGYLVLRQPGFALSGGEAQRLKIAKELCQRTPQGTLYILDEPTIGQHLDDVSRLVNVLHRLVDEGNSVFVVEHHPHLLAACDWLIELGPVGGPEGGHVVAQGSPREVAAGDSATAPYLREILEASL